MIHINKKLKLIFSIFSKVMIGFVEDESSYFFSEAETKEGFGPDTRDR